MATVLITYDLHKPGQDYTKLHEAIQGLGSTWWHFLESTWLVVTRLSPSQVWDQLASSMDKGDNCLIVDVTSRAYSGWLPETAWKWIRANV